MRLASYSTPTRGVCRVPATVDALGHGSRVADILLHCTPRAELLVAQVFRERLTTTAAQVAASSGEPSTATANPSERALSRRAR